MRLMSIGCKLSAIDGCLSHENRCFGARLPFSESGLVDYTSVAMKSSYSSHFAICWLRSIGLDSLARLWSCALLFHRPATRPRRRAANRPLLIYSIDVEGGQSTLLVSPTGESLLVDTGWPGNDGRDAGRIQAAMHDAGIKQTRPCAHHPLPRGPRGRRARIWCSESRWASFSTTAQTAKTATSRATITPRTSRQSAGTPRRIVHPGDTIDIPGLTIIVLTADGEHISAVPGVKPQPNPYCASEPQWDLDPTENPRSAGILVRYGKFRFLDLGDLTKAKEIPLVCPDNLIGTSISISSTITA